MRTYHTLRAVGFTLFLLGLLVWVGGCATAPVTVEDSVEGKVAVYATKVVDGTKAVTDKVKELEAAGVVPTDQAARVIQVAVKIDTAAAELADLLAVYDAAKSADDAPTDAEALTKIQVKVKEISQLVTALLVPLGQEEARAQVSALTTAISETLLTLQLELEKGV